MAKIKILTGRVAGIRNMFRAVTAMGVAVVTAAVLLLAGGCEKQRVYRIGVSQCSSDDWRDKMNEEIRREIMFHPDAEVEIRSAHDDNRRQIADLEYFAREGFDIVIVAPNEEAAVTPAVKKIYESGIPVIIFDRSIKGQSYTASIGVDNVGLGRQAAQYARHMLGSDWKALEIWGRMGSTPAVDRHKGFLAEISSEPGASVVAQAVGNWNQDEAEAAVDSLLNVHKDIDLIYAHNDRMAIGAANVARRRGFDNIKVIGIDAAPQIGIKAVADGTIDATFLYPTEGHRLVRTALAILKGEKFERDAKLATASAVDKTNADILLLQDQSLAEETSKMKILKSQVDSYWEKHSAQTVLFYVAIALVVLAYNTIFIVLKAYWQRRRLQGKLLEKNTLLEQERDKQKQLNEQLNAASQSKLAFFTGVSHDLRTPLTLISEPVESVSKDSNLTERQRSLMKIADKNIRILRRLINQILDFRKYETGKLAPRLEETDLCVLAREWAEAFGEVARSRHIRFNVSIPEACVEMAFDPEKMERVFFNLVSNAFKHTPDNGTICVSLRVDSGEAVFTVEDTGCGIPAADLPHVFENFYQADGVSHEGSGIGLTLSQAFVEMHGGRIEVESEVGRGSRFTVTLPVRHVAKDDRTAPSEPRLSAADVYAELADVELETPEMRADLPVMLVIDDNADIRRLVRELMEGQYNVIGARDGKEGLRMAARYVPDIIICDVMMPVMDGLEFCRLVKEEVTTSHIPVLMLTACSMDEQRATGYDSGADGYLSKPFNAEVLRARCRSLLANRKRILGRDGDRVLMNDPAAKAGKPATAAQAKLPEGAASARRLPSGDIDSEFYDRFCRIVADEMGNPELSVDSLASRMGLGRSQFYRKLKALTNYSPVELLRQMRVKRGRELLMKTEKSISEIAYEVGFSSPAYFTKCYRDQYGETPSDLRGRV